MGTRGPKPSFTKVACPNTQCRYYGQVDQGNIVGNGRYRTSSGLVRNFLPKRVELLNGNPALRVIQNIGRQARRLAERLRVYAQGCGIAQQDARQGGGCGNRGLHFQIGELSIT